MWLCISRCTSQLIHSLHIQLPVNWVLTHLSKHTVKSLTYWTFIQHSGNVSLILFFLLASIHQFTILWYQYVNVFRKAGSPIKAIRYKLPILSIIAWLCLKLSSQFVTTQHVLQEKWTWLREVKVPSLGTLKSVWN